MGVTPKKALILARGSHVVPPGERRLLERVAQALPEGPHLKIWSQLEIFDSSGATHEIDAVILGHYGLYVVDVKDLSGRIVGDERTWSVETVNGPHQVVDNPLPLVHRNARWLEDFLVQELGRGAISVEPLILLPEEGVEFVLPKPTRRHVVTAGELLRGLESGELPGDMAPPPRVPVDEPTAQAIANILGELRRRVRPGRGNLQQELSLLQRDIVADLTDTAARAPDSVATSIDGVRGEQLRHRIEEAAAAWVIACVFVRVLEERGYIERELAGEGVEPRDRVLLAGSSSNTPRDHLLHLLSAIGLHPACDSILGQANRCLWDMPPTEEGAAALLSFFRRSDNSGRDPYGRDLVSDRLWGDLYQGLSEPLRKANALLQTPSFIEAFLLDRTLDPAVAELGVAQVRVIDPACGSGTLLVGAFRRLLDRYSSLFPEGHHALAALDQVHGVDISPAATMITRIRLLLAYCEATGRTRLSGVPALPLHVVTADSLLPPQEEDPEQSTDPAVLSSPSNPLEQRYGVIVCAPPLISARDPVRREAYRERYRSAAGKFLLFPPSSSAASSLPTPAGLWACSSETRS